MNYVIVTSGAVTGPFESVTEASAWAQKNVDEDFGYVIEVLVSPE